MKFIQYLSLTVALLSFSLNTLKAEDANHSHEHKGILENVQENVHEAEHEIKHLEEEFNAGEMIMHHIADAN